MSVLQKGIVTVIVATLLASVLIIFTGKEGVASDVDNMSNVTEPLKNIVTDQLSDNVSRRVLGELTKNLLIEKSQKNQLTQKNTLLLAQVSMVPPPIGPFQVAQPMTYGSPKILKSKALKTNNNVAVTPAISMKQATPSGILLPNQNRKVPEAPTINIIKQQAPQPPQPPKGIVSSQQKLEQHSMKMIAPVNTLVKPQAPVQQVPDVFVTPQLQRNMPMPVPMNQQLPKASDIPAGVEDKNLSTNK